MIKIAFRNLWVKKSRTILAIIGLLIAVTGVISLISLSAGIRHNVMSVITQMKGVRVLQADTFDEIWSRLDIKYVKKLESLPEVKVALPLIYGIASGIEEKSTKTFQGFMSMVFYIGVDPAKQQLVSSGSTYNPDIKKGRHLLPTDKYSCVIGKTVADKYNKRVGDTIKFNDHKFRIVGIYETGTFMMDSGIFIPLSVARELSGMDKDVISTIYLEPYNPKLSDKLAKKIDFMYPDLDATSMGSTQKINQILTNIDIFFLSISLIAVFVGGIGVLNTMLMSVLERTKEFGILRAIGWRRKDLMKMVLAESLLLSLISAALGILLGVAVVYVIRLFTTFKPLVDASVVFTALIIAIILGLFGGLYPAWRASKLDPIEAIRSE
jgi:putative ABC transport system permease protein